MTCRRDVGVVTQHRQYVSWRDSAGNDRSLIALVDAVDEIPVPFIGCVKIETESAIHKRIDHVAETDKELKTKILEQQRQDVLRPYPLETLD